MTVGDVSSILGMVPFDTSRLQQDPYESIGTDFWNWVVQANEIIPAWWSVNRDIALRRFWKKSDHLAGALYAMQAKMTAIPFRIVPRDSSVKQHVRDAEAAEARLRANSELGNGYEAAYEKWILDLLTQDNGAFLLILGDGPADGPIVGPAMGVMHLDATRCTRTNNPMYPVVYYDEDGRRYKLHYTRVMYTSQLTSPIREMHGIGFCAVSRVIYTAQHLMDISRYEQEKLGSRPINSLMVGSGITGKQIRQAFRVAQAEMDNEMLQRYAKVVAIGSNQNIDLKLIDLASVPDGFDKQTDVSIAMYTIALGLGVDARELWPASASGATKADALVQHLKARGKGPGKILLAQERMFDHKYLPPHLKMVYDYIDDEQDRARAEIRRLRSQQRTEDLTNGSITVRVAREQMLDAGEIDDDQFMKMELDDGRLPDGSDVLLLFSNPDSAIRGMLSIGVANPVRVEENMAMASDILDRIQERIEQVNGMIFNAPNSQRKRDAMMALAALKRLQAMYLGRADTITGEQMQTSPDEQQQRTAPDDGDDESEQAKDAWSDYIIPDGFGVETNRSKSVHQKTLDDYRRAVRESVRGLYSRQTDVFGFVDGMVSAIQRRFTEAWNNGMSEVGIQPSEQTSAERAELDFIINREISYVLPFANDIEIGRDRDGKTLSQFLTRAEMWINAYDRVRSKAMQMARTNPKLRWVVNPAKESCSDCLRLNGRVYRAATWRRYNIAPKMRQLECRGFRCGCSFVATTDAATPGRPPNIS